MKRVFLLFLFTCTAAFALNKGDEQGMEVMDKLQLPQDKEVVQKAYAGWWAKSQKNLKQRMEWFDEAKFGCFIHWGPYSEFGGQWKEGRKVVGYTEHLMRSLRIPIAEYKEDVVKPFNPVDFNAEEWMQHAANAGMKYFVITAKHHDGFAMYFSDAYPYDMRMTKYKRDPMAELREAARKHGIKFGFYYSHAFDWEHPDAPGNDWDFPDHPGGDRLLGGRDWWLKKPEFLEKADKYVREKSIPQIQELIKKYDPDIMWFDTPHKLPLYQNIRILEALREVDPENKIVVNGRLARIANQNFGDYLNTGDRAAYFPPTKGYWEAIPTTNESYGYSKLDKGHKSPRHFVRLLASAVAKGGNILMNVGPMGNGKWDQVDVDIFKTIGDWLKVNGEAIYGNEMTDLPEQSWGVTTKKGDVTYLHVYDWPGNKELVIGGLASDVDKAWIVSDVSKTRLPAKRVNNKDVKLVLPSEKAPDSMSTVIAVTLKNKKKNYPVRLLDPARENILFVFDSDINGVNGKDYEFCDGKPGRNYAENWKSKDLTFRWKFRLNEPTKYKVHLQYSSDSAKNTGVVVLSVNGKSYEISYPVKGGTNTVYVTDIEFKPGEYEFLLEGKEYEGSQFMRPMCVILKK